MKNMKSSQFKIFAVLFILCLILAVSADLVFAAADDYPNKPIRLLNSGTSTERVGRMIGEKLSPRLGQQIYIESRPGAGGLIAGEIASKANPDGYTAFIIAAFYPIIAAVYDPLPFDPVKSFIPVVKIATGPNILVVHPSVPANTLEEFIAYAKKKPGELVWGTSSAGTNTHLAAENFQVKTGTKFKIMHFKNTGSATADLLGGHSQVMFTSYTTVIPHVKSGKLRPLATGTLKRTRFLPDLPTVKEVIGKEYEATGWWGILMPAGTPGPIVERWNKEIKEILSDDQMQKAFLNQGAEVDYLGTTEFSQWLKGELVEWAQTAKDANVKLKR